LVDSFIVVVVFFCQDAIVRKDSNYAGPIKYFAPEQMDDASPSKEADVFSFGVLMFEIFAEEKPWSDVNQLQGILFDRCCVTFFLFYCCGSCEKDC
jgi:serine/threonine protein kinase